MLTVSGKVDHQLDLSPDALKKYESKTISVPGKDNTTETYTGVSYNKLLEDAAPTAAATMANMTGSDGYNKAIELAKIRAQPDAIIAIGADKSLKAVIPNESRGARVGKLATIVIE